MPYTMCDESAFVLHSEKGALTSQRRIKTGKKLKALSNTLHGEQRQELASSILK